MLEKSLWLVICAVVNRESVPTVYNKNNYQVLLSHLHRGSRVSACTNEGLGGKMLLEL